MISRRQLLAAMATGAAIGLAGVLATQPEASIRFIGQRSTIVGVFGTPDERVLFVLGDPDDDLLTYIPVLDTVGNSGIDLVIATHRVLANRHARELLRVHSVPVISIQGSTSLPPIRGDVTPVTHAIAITLGETSSLRIVPVLTEEDHPDYAVVINCQFNRIVLCSSKAASRHVPAVGCEVLAMPGEPEAAVVDLLKPQILICNKPLASANGVAQMQVYRTDPQVICIREGMVTVQDAQLSS